PPTASYPPSLHDSSDLQGLFRAEDNLESRYAAAALRQLYIQLYRGAVPCCSLTRFMDATGLDLTDADGGLRDELPPISTFLNRLARKSTRLTSSHPKIS